MIDRRERRIDDLRRHEVGEDLLHPDIVEPPHRHEIAEPHVRRLVRDEAGAAELLALRRRRIEQQRRRVVEDRARVLHPAELERRYEQEIELAPGIRDAGVALEPVERTGVQIEDRVTVPRHLGGIGLAMEHAERPPGSLGGLDREPAGSEREQVGRQRLGFGELDDRPLGALAGFERGAVGDGVPRRGDLEADLPARLEIRLVEAGKCQVGAGRHEQRVEVLVVAVERVVGSVEVDGDLVGALRQGRGWNHQVVRRARQGDGPAARCRAPDRAAGAEVQHQVARGTGERESYDRASRHRRRPRRRHRNAELVTQIADPLRA